MEALYAMPIGLFIAIGRNFDPSQIIEMNASEWKTTFESYKNPIFDFTFIECKFKWRF